LKQARDEGRLSKVPLEKHLPIYTARDLGINDYMSLIIFQIYGKEIRVVDSYYNDGEPLDFYISRLKQANYKIEKHYLPHDANTMSRQTGKTDYDVITGL
jgi:phage terminase large subunit